MGKTVVITGSTRGIGFGLARCFLERGCNVVLNGSSPESTSKAMAKLQGYREHVVGIPADISGREGITLLYDEAVSHFGHVDIWINNAGIGHEMLNAWELDYGELSKVLRVNIDGVVSGTIIPFLRMKEQGGGKIFNMEGLGSDGLMLDGMTIYGTSKSALTYFTRSFAHEASGTSVQIGTISPGMVVTDMLLRTVSGGSAEILRKKKFFNLMADTVETVAPYLTEKILDATAQSPKIKWLTKPKMVVRILMAPFRKRNLFS
ncbi:MAG: SDR family oxidoreductase [Chlorobiaceae bacterium]|jgi:NAD(P)-dependent dehydrogenase (short-subunit alcohol dehydrogenase family)|nr:SDR family oxidoreductase [Chlorobiaceae bacterium]NTV16212.1 SDR family oxidoreductase [Chlorobiaceae bacterium]